MLPNDERSKRFYGRGGEAPNARRSEVRGRHAEIESCSYSMAGPASSALPLLGKDMRSVTQEPVSPRSECRVAARYFFAARVVLSETSRIPRKDV